VIRAERNIGFGPANNLAAAGVRGSFIALINSDAYVHPGALDLLVDKLIKNPSTALTGPLLLNLDGSIQESRFPYPTPARAWLENLGFSKLARFLGRGQLDRTESEWLSGACLVVRREVWEQSGGFDESFFLYAEETDWQRRLRDAGWEIHFVPEAKVTHVGGASGLERCFRVRERFFEGADRYILKHHGLSGAVSFRAATAVGAALRWARCVAGGIIGLGGQQSAKAWAWLLGRQLFRRLPENPPPMAAVVDKPCGAD
jgi:GT2 family glycosyltransferase